MSDSRPIPTPELPADVRGGCSSPSPCSAFRTIVADPPWRYNRKVWNKNSPHYDHPKSGGTSKIGRVMPYEEMTLDEIKALPVGKLAADNCDLYLWTTQKHLRQAFDVLDAWGFRYCQTLTWCKTPRGIGMGGLYCPTTEFLLLGRRGKIPAKRRNDSTWWHVRSPRNRHSEKPEFFQDVIEAMSDAPRLELFARRKRLGWLHWGNEVASDVEMPNSVLNE